MNDDWLPFVVLFFVISVVAVPKAWVSDTYVNYEQLNELVEIAEIGCSTFGGVDRFELMQDAIPDQKRFHDIRSFAVCENGYVLENVVLYDAGQEEEVE